MNDIIYTIPTEEQAVLIIELDGVNPFSEDTLSKSTIEHYNTLDIDIEAACYRAYSTTISSRYQAVVDPKELRVYRALNMDNDPLVSDFTILGFRKVSPSYIKGRKVSSKYICITTNEAIVEKIFTDVIVDGVLTGLEVTFNFFCEDNTIGLSKTETVKEYNKYEAETEMRKRRGRIIDYLVAGAKGTPVETYLTMIFDHYYEESMKFREKGSSDFTDAINSETDVTINAILNTEVAPGITVRLSILGQLND